MGTGADGGDDDHQRPDRGGWPLPVERADESEHHEGNDRRPQHGRVGLVVARGEAGQDLVARPQHGADQRQQQRPVELLEARSHDQHDAQEARADGQPSCEAGAFAEEEHAQRDHDQRRGRGHGMGIGQRQVAEGQHEHRAFDYGHDRAQDLQLRPLRLHRRPDAALAGDEGGEETEQAVADPHHLADGIVDHQHLGDGIHGGEAQHRQHGEQGAELVIRPRCLCRRAHAAVIEVSCPLISCPICRNPKLDFAALHHHIRRVRPTCRHQRFLAIARRAPRFDGASSRDNPTEQEPSQPRAGTGQKPLNTCA